MLLAVPVELYPLPGVPMPMPRGRVLKAHSHAARQSVQV